MRDVSRMRQTYPWGQNLPDLWDKTVGFCRVPQEVSSLFPFVPGTDWGLSGSRPWDKAEMSREGASKTE